MTSRNTRPPALFRRPTDAALELRRRIRQNSAVSLGGFFRQLARASVAASIVAAAGCGSSHSPGDRDASPPMGDASMPDGGDAVFEEPLCVDGRWRPTRDINAAAEYDYLALYQVDPWGPSTTPTDEDGTPCASASDVASCEAQVLARGELFRTHLLTTDEDGAHVHEEPGEVAEFLGPIDTAQEALVVVWHAGYSIHCGDTSQVAVREVDDGYEVYATRMTADCDPVIIMRYLLHVARDAALTVLDEVEISREVGVCVGRRPEGLRTATTVSSEDPIAHFFGHIARLEAAAVDAFEVLARELSALGAPDSLVEDCLDAARDEVRHAHQMATLARRFGGEAVPADVEPRPLRSLYEIALSNAVEGCVRETFGALVGVHQSLSADDPIVADTMRQVAEDETRHAALSWRIAEWMEPRLSTEQRQTIARARARAITDLRAEMCCPVDETLRRKTGLPSSAHAVSLVDQLATTIWA